MKTQLIALTGLLAVFGPTVSGCGGGDGDPPLDAADELTLTELPGNFIGPESAHWDAANQVWYVANFGQNLDLSGMTPDAPGYVSRLAPDGSVLDERFVELDGDLLGMAVLDGTLYVSHGSDLIEIDTSDGSFATVDFPSAAFLNDVAAGGGAVYVSDTAANLIYRYIPGGQPEVFSQDPAITAPNGLFVDGDEIVVNTLGAFPPDPATPGGVFVLNAAGEATRLGTLEGVFDGLEKAGDAYLVSDFNGPISLVDSTDGSVEFIVDVAADPHLLASAADIGFDPDTGVVMLPDLIGNKLYTFTLP